MNHKHTKAWNNAPAIDLRYKKASLDDLELLTKTRIQVLRAANRLDDSANMSEVEAESRAYYKRALADGTHTAYLVFDGETFVGAGGISYYTVMPTFHNPTGKKAYVREVADLRAFHFLHTVFIRTIITTQSTIMSARKKYAAAAGSTSSQTDTTKRKIVITVIPPPATLHSFFASYLLFSFLLDVLYPAIRPEP